LPIIEGKLPEGIQPISQKLLEDENNITLDFSSIPKEHKDIKTLHKQEQTLNEHYMANIESINSQLDKLVPNLRAMERLDDVSKRLDDTVSSFEKSRKVSKKIRKHFEEAKAKRKERFMEAFKQISESIEEIYKSLTGRRGIAYLTPDNNDEPYLSGITYNPVPPGKPFGDISSLSGGEKSIATLALLFAIQSVKKSPFFILDEIDQSLDVNNVTAIADFFKEKSKEVQFIVISHNNRLYSQAEALIGVYRVPQRPSRILQLNLSSL